MCIYSEEDKRIALGANIGGWLNDFIGKDGDAWYLTGDAMFLNAVEGDFHPRKKNGKYFPAEAISFPIVTWQYLQ